MAAVTLDNLTVRFGDVTAVDRVDLEIADGELVVFLGPSGCGKTTTLRCIAGLEQPSDGAIRFDDEAIDHRTAAERNVAMVFQFVSLYPHLRVADNIAFPLQTRGRPKSEIKERIAWAAKQFQLVDELRQFPGGLPPGTKQKVALARAVIRDPKVLLLDEPLSALDERFREEMRWELGHLQKDLGITTVYVTHDQREAMSLADRIVLMQDGRIVQTGTPREMYSDPINEFAAFFIGSPSMNFIDVEPDEAGLRLGEEGLLLPLSNVALAALHEQPVATLRLGIRPQHLALTSPSGDRVDGLVQARLLDRYSVGREHFFDIGIDDRTLVGMKITPDAGSEPNVDSGPGADEHAVVHFDLDHTHVFDRKTGQRLPVALGPTARNDELGNA